MELLTNPFTQARHALTTDRKFIWATGGTKFSYLRFYHTIIKTVSGWSQAEQTQLIGWWNGYVLSKPLAIRFVFMNQTYASNSLYIHPFLLNLPSTLSPRAFQHLPFPHVPYPAVGYCHACGELLA